MQIPLVAAQTIRLLSNRRWILSPLVRLPPVHILTHNSWLRLLGSPVPPYRVLDGVYKESSMSTPVHTSVLDAEHTHGPSPHLRPLPYLGPWPLILPAS